MADTQEPDREPAGRRTNEIDATGLVVAANVRRLRSELQLTTGQLAALLEAAGRPIIANAITKIEQGRRRVSVDDLMSLAIALNVTPNALLLPHALKDRSRPTGAQDAVSGAALWSWACGYRPLPPTASVGSAESTRDSEQRDDWFERQSAPHAEAPEQALFHQQSIVRTLKSMTAIVESIPAMTETLAGAAQRYAKTWNDVAELLARDEEASDEVSRADQLVALEDLIGRVDEIEGR